MYANANILQKNSETDLKKYETFTGENGSLSNENENYKNKGWIKKDTKRLSNNFTARVVGVVQ